MIGGISGGGYDVTSIWQNLFKKIDQNGDGSIDKTEIESIVSKSDLNVEDVFTKLDTDQDGVIGQNEYQDALSKLQAQFPHPPPEMGKDPGDLFSKMDSDGDGSVSKAELTTFMGKDTSVVDKILSEVDTDNDGVISRAESDAHLEKQKGERKAGPPPEFAMNQTDNQEDWETMMIQRLLNAYNVGSNETGGETSRYA